MDQACSLGNSTHHPSRSTFTLSAEPAAPTVSNDRCESQIRVRARNGMAKPNPMPPLPAPKSSAMVIALRSSAHAPPVCGANKIDSKTDGGQRCGNQHELPSVFPFASAINRPQPGLHCPRCTAPCSGALTRFRVGWISSPIIQTNMLLAAIYYQRHYGIPQ